MASLSNNYKNVNIIYIKVILCIYQVNFSPTEVSVHLAFSGLKAGATENPDGWGVAWYEAKYFAKEYSFMKHKPVGSRKQGQVEFDKSLDIT